MHGLAVLLGDEGGREAAVGIVVILKTEGNLLQVVAALRSPGCFPCFREGRKKQDNHCQEQIGTQYWFGVAASWGMAARKDQSNQNGQRDSQAGTHPVGQGEVKNEEQGHREK